VGRKPSNALADLGEFLSEQIVRAALSFAGFLASVGLIRRKSADQDRAEVTENPER